MATNSENGPNIGMFGRSRWSAESLWFSLLHPALLQLLRIAGQKDSEDRLSNERAYNT